MTSQSKSLHEEGLRASNPMITWLHAHCVASAAVHLGHCLFRYQHSKDDMTTSLQLQPFCPRRYSDQSTTTHLLATRIPCLSSSQTITPPSSSTTARSLNNKQEAIASLASPTLYPPFLSTVWEQQKKNSTIYFGKKKKRYKRKKRNSTTMTRTPNITRRPVDTNSTATKRYTTRVARTRHTKETGYIGAKEWEGGIP